MTTTDDGEGATDWSALLHPDHSELTGGRRGDGAIGVMDLMYTSGTTGSPKAVVVRYGPPADRRLCRHGTGWDS